MAAGEALAGFLRALGVAANDIPAEAEERAAKYRSMLAGRRMLVMLDNARSAEQVGALLPGSGACVAPVSSRDALAGLAARDGARAAEQVGALLPGSGACVALVTSRDALAGLVARDGARRLELDLLPLAD